MPEAPRQKAARQHLLLLLSGLLVVPAVVLVAALVGSESSSGVSSSPGASELLGLRGLDIGGQPPAWPDVVAGIKPFALAQGGGEGSKRVALRNVLSRLAQKLKQSASVQHLSTPSDKVALTMYMESECPACRRFSTTIVKQILEAPGVGEIVDFRAVPWGWGKVVEAPTAQQLKANPEAFNVLNRSAQLLPILSRLGARDAETPPLHFECQHGEGECTGNALEACLQDVAPNHERFFPVMDCIESRTCAEGMKPPMCLGQPKDVADQCMQEYGRGIDVSELNGCFTSSRVQELMLMNDMQTMEANPQWVPWFQLDGRNLVPESEILAPGANDTKLFRQQFLLGKRICDLYVAKTGKPAPSGCSSFWQTEAEVPRDPFASFPQTNFSSLIAQEARKRATMVHQPTAEHIQNESAGKASSVSTAAAARGTAGSLTAKLQDAAARVAAMHAKVSLKTKPLHDARQQKYRSFMAYQKQFLSADALTAEALQDARIDSDHVKAFAESEGESDASARSWKPPGTKFV